jgi:hypothetical protein
VKLNILLLCNKPQTSRDANTILDHIEAIENYSSHTIWCYSNMGDFSPKLDLKKFDAIIIHYSLTLIHESYLSEKAKEILRAYQGLKIIFIQDEYRQINKIVQTLQFLKIDVLWTCFPEKVMQSIYPEEKLPHLSKYNNLTGYVSENLLKNTTLPSMAERSMHVGYRGRKLPFWYGELAYEKWNIVDTWKHYVKDEDIQADLSYQEKDRIYGKKWIEFLSHCKTTLGVESGASVMDFTGELERKIELHQLLHPEESFHSVQAKYLADLEGLYPLNQISPRCFEAIALKTVLVLYEGEYSGILIPGRHYIALKKDFSNIASVLACIRDDSFLHNMAEVAYQEIALNPEYSYAFFIKKVDAVIHSAFLKRNKTRIKKAYTLEEFQYVIHYYPIRTWIKKKSYAFCFGLYQKLPYKLKLCVKIFFRPKWAFKAIAQKLIRLLRGIDASVTKTRL